MWLSKKLLQDFLSILKKTTLKILLLLYAPKARYMKNSVKLKKKQSYESDNHNWRCNNLSKRVESDGEFFLEFVRVRRA